MTSYRVAFVLCLACAAMGAGERIYKTVDEHGNIVFTDVPPKEGDQSEQVNVVPLNTIDLTPAEPAKTLNAPANDEQVSGDYYSELAVASPSNDEAVRENAGNVVITAAVNPPLVPGHRLLLVFDDEPTEIEADDSSFYITNVDRGSHSVAVRVVDRAGNVLKQSAPVTFHLQRASVNSPARPAPAPHRGT
jgi:hypothetical protein